MALVKEHHVEQQALDWLQELGYERKRATDLSSEHDPERADYRAVVLEERLQSALTRFNPDLPPEAINTALAQLIRPDHPSLIACNRQLHQQLTKGITVTVHQDHQEFGEQLKVIDFDSPQNNDWLVVDQMIVQGSKRARQPDLVIFVNGLPLAVMELKNPADEQTDIWKAYEQLQAYKEDIPDLFNYNVCLAISDGIQARVGSLTASEERFMRWRTIDGRELDPLGSYQELQTLIKGLFQKEVFLNYLRFFCLFEEDKEITKKIAGYHQYHAVQAALESIVAASQTNGSKKGGVIWHTQGAGKSLEMACLAGRLISDPRLENPTILMVTDRQNLDGQLFSVFAHARDFLGETPQQVTSRAELRACLMNRPSGGIIFTTIQKFAVETGEDRFPLLTPRHNIVVIADEAHRTQYGFKGTLDSRSGEIKYGLAKALREALPNATFLAFTGTPISQADRDTQAVFGDYISIYDIQQAVQDGATVPIYYESRLAKVNLRQEDLANLDEEIEDILESDDTDECAKEKVKSRWATLETIVGTDSRLQDVAEDIIHHYETRQQTQRGKALIVAMSRDIAVRLYDKIITLRPHWHSESVMSGTIKVVMTTSAGDHLELQRHHTTSSEKKDLEKRFKDPEDALQIVIVRDMWLTGFDAPCLSTLYIDKPMQGANLVQAIARVNRVFQDKPGGLVVDYMGIAPQLKEALNTYSAAQGKGRQIMDVSEALRLFKEKIQVARDLLHPFDWSHYRANALSLIPPCLDHILQKEDGKKRYCDTVLQMTKAFSLCGTLEEALSLSAEVAFHQALRAPLIKSYERDAPQRRRNINDLRQLISQAIVGDGVSDIFRLAGLQTPDISILSDDFLKEVEARSDKNLAVELLERLIKDEIHTKFKTNLVKKRKFSELLTKSLHKYNNRVIEASQVIEELIAMAKEFKTDLKTREQHNLTSEEEAFYDALAQNQSAQELMGEKVLVEMARAVAQKIRDHLTVDWNIKESVRSRLRLHIRTLLKRYKYPPDQQKEAAEMVLRQAEVFSENELT